MVVPHEETTTMPRKSYRGIAEDLADKIKAGEYQPGERLPTYPELADLYDVSVSTAQRAITVLEIQGYVIPEQGRGLFVAETLPD